MEDKTGFNSAMSSYMLVRYLSMRMNLLPYAEIIQMLQRANISDRDIYIWAYKNIPAGNPYIKYIKGKTKND